MLQRECLFAWYLLLIECLKPVIRLDGLGSNAVVCNLYNLHLQNLIFKFKMFLRLLPNELLIF
jgi:hypothetical protein